MAAPHTLTHVPAVPQISKSGVLTLYGYGIRVSMQSGHLQIEDGIGPERRKFRLPRVNHRLKRLVCIADDGFITLSALRWLSEVGASFVMLNRLGKVRVVTGPTSPSEARLRRAQALALGNGTAVKIARELISAKLTGQEMLVREKLKNVKAANSIAGLEKRLADTDNVDGIRSIESRGAAEYWSAWREVPILFARKDVTRVPTHWLCFGTRHSPLTGGPRLSVNPANSLLNYTNAVAESECRLAASACGLDPGIGFLHTDTANRDSLALDLIETIRPAIEAWLLHWLMSEPLRRSDFSESSDGNCRISSALCSKLSQTAPTWGKLVAPWAEYVTHSLYSGRSAQAGSVCGLKTPLTQTHRRQAKGGPAPKLRMLKTEHLCRGCGKPIRKEHEDCGDCAVSRATGRLVKAARIGRIAANSPEARAKHAESARIHALARSSWNGSGQAAWLTHDLFTQKVQPLLASVSSSGIRSRIGVSHWYANKIRQGYRPHPRHWKALADLVGVAEQVYPPTIPVIAQTFETVFSQYVRHPEYKSIAPNGTPCRADTHGLLKRYPVTATEFHLIGKETERGWEQAEDISTLLPSLKRYERNAGRVNESLRERLRKVSLHTLQRETGLSRHTILRARQGKEVRPRSVQLLKAAVSTAPIRKR